MSNDVDRVRNAVDIVALVSRTIKLKRAGKNFTGLCPFHEDTKPSLTVSPEIQRYRCWACGAQGDAFNWVMETEKMTFPEALRELAAANNIKLEQRGKRDPGEAERYADIMRATQEFFVAQLEASPKILDYCEKRGFDAEVRKTWGLGYAPEHGEALTMHLKKAGYKLSEAAKLWVLDEKHGGFGDRFRHRLMFPIRNERGRLVGYGGRAMGEMGPKYLNSGDTPIFYKSSLLYGLDKAAHSIGEQDEAVMCEGYTDVIACHRAGVTTAIATLGTSCTEKHAQLLKRWCNRVVLLYDGDTAGQQAAERASQILGAHEIETRLALIADGGDPDTVLQQKGAEFVKRMVADAKPVTMARLELLLSKSSPSGAGFWNEAIAILRGEPDPILREQAISWLAGKNPSIRQQGAAADAIRQKLRSQDRKPQKGARAPNRPTIKIGPEANRLLPSERSIFVSLTDPELREQAWQVIQENIFESQPARLIGAYLLQKFDGAPQSEMRSWISSIEEQDVQNWLTDIMLNDSVGSKKQEFLNEAALYLRRQALRRKAESQMRSGEADPAEIHRLFKQASGEQGRQKRKGSD